MLIALRDAGGQTGDNGTDAVEWSTTRATRTFGGAADTWNAGLSDSDVRAATFGIDLYVFNDDQSENRTAYVYCCRIRIHYTEGAPEVAHEKSAFFKML
jgi:hypothetical protein